MRKSIRCALVAGVVLVGALWIVRRRPAGGPKVAGPIAVWAAEAGVLMVILWFALHAYS